jgi:hypothetical protein
LNPDFEVSCPLLADGELFNGRVAEKKVNFAGALNNKVLAAAPVHDGLPVHPKKKKSGQQALEAFQCTRVAVSPAIGCVDA